MDALPPLPSHRIATATGTLEVTAGLNGRNTWTVLETKSGQDQACMINFGVGFQVSDKYPLANWAPVAPPAVTAAPPADRATPPAETSKLGAATPATSKSSISPSL